MAQKGNKMDLQRWLDEIQEQIAILNVINPYYEEANRVLPVANLELLDQMKSKFSLDLPQQLIDFYHVCGGVDLGDVEAGYFILPLK
jgi:hypothetical protein